MPEPIWLIIPCAGKGTRFGSSTPKQYLPLLGSTVLQKTLAKFITRADIKGIIIPHAENDTFVTKILASDEKYTKIHCVIGGAERADSVLNALNYLQSLADFKAGDFVAVHDAARPCIASDDLDALFTQAINSQTGAILATSAIDTIKQITLDPLQIDKTLDRRRIVMAQTPQVFNANALLAALKACKNNNSIVTDEASAMEAIGINPAVVLGKKSNIKITTAEDLVLAAFYLSQTLANKGQTECA